MSAAPRNGQLMPFEIEALPCVGERLAAGQKFNAYHLTGGGYIVAIGPVTDALLLAQAEEAATADLLVAALRAFVGQPPSVSPLALA